MLFVIPTTTRPTWPLHFSGSVKSSSATTRAPSMRSELALEQARNRTLAERLRAAGTRLDALLMRLPEAAE